MSLNEKAFARAAAFTTALFDIIGYIWHGLLGQPSFMNSLYPGFWSNYTLMLIALAGTVALAYVLGYVFALCYNKHEKKK